MEDSRIVELFLQRDESAISETQRKYGNYLTKIAYNILADVEDSRESVNDTYLKAWYSIPPQMPSVLSTFLGRITRQISIDIYRKRNAKKRQGSEYALALDELYDCASPEGMPEKEVEAQLLAKCIGDYLMTLSEEKRNVFVRRYYFIDSVRDIADCFGISEAKVKSILHRTRLGLKQYLEKEDLL